MARTARGRWRHVQRGLSFACGAMLIVAWALYLSPAGLGGPVRLVWVSGTSMEPALYTGDLAVLYERDSYEVDDVVAFSIPEGGTVIHRVVGVTDSGYRFRGDNRNNDDPWMLGNEAVQGRQVFHVPHAANVITYLGQPVVLALLVAALVMLGLMRAEQAKVEPVRLPWLFPTPSRRRRSKRAQRITARQRSALSGL